LEGGLYSSVSFLEERTNFHLVLQTRREIMPISCNHTKYEVDVKKRNIFFELAFPLRMLANIKSLMTNNVK